MHFHMIRNIAVYNSVYIWVYLLNAKFYTGNWVNLKKLNSDLYKK